MPASMAACSTVVPFGTRDRPAVDGERDGFHELSNHIKQPDEDSGLRDVTETCT